MHNSADDTVVVSGTVLQRLMQENLRYGNGVGPENQAMASPSNPVTMETLLPETQPRQEPQGQEHQVDSSSMEKNAKGAQNTAASVQVTLAVPGLGALELPSYEEAKSQSQLYRGQQGQNEEQNVARTHTHVHNMGNTLINPGHTYTSLKNANQALSNPNPGQNPQTPMSLQPNQHIPTSTSSCPPSLSSAPSLSSFARAEGRSWVQRGFTGVDEGLAGLEQGHVRSLSERIMQLSLERNGAKQPRETSPNGEERTTATSPSSSSKTAAPPPPKGSLEPRGPPPEYPYKAKAQPAYPSSISPGPLSLEQTPLSMDAALGQISSLMPPVVPQTGSGTRLPPQGQIVPAEAFSMMSHAQHMMTFLSDENQRLRQELLIQTEKTGKLQRLEAEVQRLSDAYENLVRSSSKRETLDKTMRMKLEGEIRRLHDFNRDLRDRLETANRKLANQDAEGQEDGHVYLSESEVAQVFSGSIMHNSADDTVVVSGTVLQRLMQENLRYGNGVGPENQAMASPSNPVTMETLLPETQPRQEPQGQEHQVDSSSMEKNAKGAQNTAASVQVTLAVPGLGALELPSYEEAKSQSQLYRGQQGQNEEQNVARTHTHVHNMGNTLTNPGHTYTSLKNANQALSNPNPGQNPQTPMSLQPNQHIPTSTSSCPPSLSSAPSLSSFARAEGRSWVQRGFTGVDEGLAGLEQGHVRSLSERIMQLSLERNGAKQPRETSPNGEERTTATSPSSSSKTAAPPPPKGSLEPRGPPPEYPYKAKAQPAYPSSISPGPLSLEQTPLSMDAALGQISSLMPPVVPQTGSGTRLPPQGQIVPAEAFSMMSHAQHMMTFLSDENQRLRQELLIQTEKTGKLQRLEAEVQRLSDAYENLVRSSSKRETLDKTMRMKLEGEIRRLHDFNRDLRDRLETANRKLANQDAEGQEDGHVYLSENRLETANRKLANQDAEGQEDGHVYLSERRESLKEMERLEMEAESLRSANEDQRRHIEILEQALNNAQSKVVRLEEELGRKCVYVERVERLQQALAQLQAACEKREQLEKRLRTRLERELETLRSQQRAGVGVCESSAPALLDLLREREERILGLEADRMRWEQKYLEESAMRQFAMEAAATAAAQRDTTIMQHSRSGSYSDACLWPHDGDDKTYSRRCQDIETRMKDLHAQLLEKIAMIKVLQHRSRRDSAPLRPARSVPSIAVATGVHSRQASQTESVLLGKENPAETAARKRGGVQRVSEPRPLQAEGEQPGWTAQPLRRSLPRVEFSTRQARRSDRPTRTWWRF
ncbi:hypothetical protein PGIGA_G00123090 [Pangasianodon gigas]|uniref:Uncharacterized protein n=1 Tax=Pangasianodon gigas TaxID=30993 RepID=A0ACC5XGY6_PANGG|nr:hypothetical protein [Pangasianodon gigas]